MSDVNALQLKQDSGSAGYVLMVSLVAAVGGLLFGFDTAVIAGATEFLKTHYMLNSLETGFAMSSALIGCIFGAAFAGYVSDKIGRKKTLLICAVLFAISAIGSGLPRTLSGFVIARLIGGIGVGAAAMVSPMYIAEIAPARIRGRLVSLNQLAIVIGMLVAYFVDLGLCGIINDNTWLSLTNTPESADYLRQMIPELFNTNWRLMFASETLPAVLFFLLLIPAPESPRWLTEKKRENEALSILTKVDGVAHAKAEIISIKEAIQQECGTFAEIFSPGIRVATLIGVALAILQQVTGINVILYYAPVIFKSMGTGTDTSLWQTVIIGAVNLLCTILAIGIVDKVGRKALLLIGSAGMGICLMLTGYFLKMLSTAGTESSYAMLTLISIISYVAFFAISLGPVVWVVVSEIFPNKIRGRAMSFATVWLWVACFAVSLTFPIMMEKLNPMITFGIYAAMCAITFVFVLLALPETKGKTLEEIEKFWK